MTHVSFHVIGWQSLGGTLSWLGYLKRSWTIEKALTACDIRYACERGNGIAKAFRPGVAMVDFVGSTSEGSQYFTSIIVTQPACINVHQGASNVHCKQDKQGFPAHGF